VIDKNKRLGFQQVKSLLRNRLSEKAPGKIQFLAGPRQVGKTTLLLELAGEWGAQALYASADAPEASLPGWADGVWRRAVDLCGKGPAVLFIDEIQYLPDWQRWLKGRFDALVRARQPVHVVATGSSALTVGEGTRETMAGRFERVVLNHWSAADLVSEFGLSAADACARIVSRGGYPGAVAFWDQPDRWLQYVRDSMIEPAIGRDILQLERVRKPALLRQVFALAASQPAEIMSLEKMAGVLAEKGALETIAHYLGLLEEAFLVKPVRRFSGAEIRRRKSPPKLVMLNNALLCAVGSGSPPTAAGEPGRWGRWVENACLAHAINAGREVHYWREEPWEVDAVIGSGDDGCLLEVKTGRYGVQDLRGLAHACERLPGLRPLVLCDPGEESVARAAGFDAAAWPDFLMDSTGSAKNMK
jgi:predicted AAA+ superfamily ATPase